MLNKIQTTAVLGLAVATAALPTDKGTGGLATVDTDNVPVVGDVVDALPVDASVGSPEDPVVTSLLEGLLNTGANAAKRGPQSDEGTGGLATVDTDNVPVVGDVVDALPVDASVGSPENPVVTSLLEGLLKPGETADKRGLVVALRRENPVLDANAEKRGNALEFRRENPVLDANAQKRGITVNLKRGVDIALRREDSAFQANAVEVDTADGSVTLVMKDDAGNTLAREPIPIDESTGIITIEKAT